MQDNSEKLPNEKDANAVKVYFRNYIQQWISTGFIPSDMKKMVKWLEVLKKNDIKIELSKEPEEEKKQSRG